MERMAKDIRYQYMRIDHGGIVRITTSNDEALSAIHQFNNVVSGTFVA
jgi:hypothetical protein